MHYFSRSKQWFWVSFKLQFSRYENLQLYDNCVRTIKNLKGLELTNIKDYNGEFKAKFIEQYFLRKILGE